MNTSFHFQNVDCWPNTQAEDLMHQVQYLYFKDNQSWSKTHFLSCTSSSSMQNSVNVSTATQCLPGHSTAPGWEARGWWWASHSLSSSLSHTSAHPPLSGLVGGGEKAELVNSFMTFNYWYFTWKNVKENQDISNKTSVITIYFFIRFFSTGKDESSHFHFSNIESRCLFHVYWIFYPHLES